jgi:hypothetical protein
LFNDLFLFIISYRFYVSYCNYYKWAKWLILVGRQLVPHGSVTRKKMCSDVLARQRKSLKLQLQCFSLCRVCHSVTPSGLRQDKTVSFMIWEREESSEVNLGLFWEDDEGHFTKIWVAVLFSGGHQSMCVLSPKGALQSPPINGRCTSQGGLG